MKVNFDSDIVHSPECEIVKAAESLKGHVATST